MPEAPGQVLVPDLPTGQGGEPGSRVVPVTLDELLVEVGCPVGSRPNLVAVEHQHLEGAEILRTNPRFTLRAFAAYAPFTHESSRDWKVEMLRRAGVPE